VCWLLRVRILLLAIAVSYNGGLELKIEK
jgi:hypothetical protein